MVERGNPAVAILLSLVMVITGVWILIGIYPFTSQMFGVPIWRGFSSLLPFFWWFVWKILISFTLIILGGWITWKSVTE